MSPSRIPPAPAGPDGSTVRTSTPLPPPPPPLLDSLPPPPPRPPEGAPVAPPANPRRCRGTSGEDAIDQHPLLPLDAERFGQFGAQELDADAEPPAPDGPGPRQFPFDLQDGVDGDREPDSLAPAHHRGVDPHDFSPGVEKGPTGVSGVDGCVGLDQVAARVGPQVRSPGGADYPYGHGALEPEGVPHGDRPLPDPDPSGIPENSHGELARRLDPQEGDVGARVRPDDLRPVLGAVGEPGGDLVGVPDGVLVCYDEPVLPDDDAGPKGVLPKPSVLLHQLREIILKAAPALRSTRCAPPRKTGDRPDVHHRGHRPLHGCDKPLLHPGDVRGIRG